MTRVKICICKGALICGILFISQTWVHAQKKISNFVYAVTGESRGSVSWNTIRILDLSTGEEQRVVLNGSTRGTPVYESVTGRKFGDAELAAMPYGKVPSNVAASGIAAMALDKKHNRLYFTPLQIGQLRYIDLNSPDLKIYFVTGKAINPDGDSPKEETMITRMVIAADGNGYAITNDGNHLLKFNTSKQTTITDLGALVDDAKNESISIHNKCTSWGGDIISDALNNLYLFTNGNAVFKIDTRNLKATWLGNIKGLPANFTTNGAAVLDDGSIAISSAYSTIAYFKVDMSTLNATQISAGQNVFNTSDLATGNLAFDYLSYDNPLLTSQTIHNDRISMYPNPVSEGNFRVSFDNNPKGEYQVQILDYMGRQVLSKKIILSFINQIEQIQLSSSTAKGVYMVKVIDASKKAIFSDKIIVP